MPDFTEEPIINSPYKAPVLHWRTDESGRPVSLETGRRLSRYFIPIPAAKKAPHQAGKLFERTKDNATVNSIRNEVQKWRALPPEKWGVSSATRILLEHWRSLAEPHPLFYCQLEAAETLIWLNEVAPKTEKGKALLQHIEKANNEANAGLFRMAAKMATGAGKTTVMAMLIAYHAINKARAPRRAIYSDRFLIIAPGITIKNRLRVLLPQDPENYYETRGIVPPEMRREIKRATVVITNFQALQLKETLKGSKRPHKFANGRAAQNANSTKESDGAMLRRVCGELLGAKDVIVINDEAHHCYKRRENGDDEERPAGSEEQQEIAKNDAAARLWINGIYALGRKVSVKKVYDLSATPFFLRGSGYREGDLFPWVVSDFSLMDAIECGIVKLPRVPVGDAAEGEEPIDRHLYEKIKKDLPKTGGGKRYDPQDLPTQLVGAVEKLYNNYEKTYKVWAEKVDTPPVFIVVCNNTSTSKLIYDYLSGYEKDGQWYNGAFRLFNNVGGDGKPMKRPRTLLIDSERIESGEALTKDFKKAAATEIELFKREMRIRQGRAVEKITDEELLREAMNTVGKSGKLGGQIRCVVSVSMLTEGWDANNVTHILGVRAFGTQLLCEQVVGRALRRFSYEMEEGADKFSPEYADVFGVPFSFAPSITSADILPPKDKVRVYHLPERRRLEIIYPRLRGYYRRPEEKRIVARFTRESQLEITAADAPPVTDVQAIVGKGLIMTLENLEKRRLHEVEFSLAAHVCRHMSRVLSHNEDGAVAPAYFRDILPIVRLWLNKHVICKDGTCKQYLLWSRLAQKAAERIHRACAPEGRTRMLLPKIDPYTPTGDTHDVDFKTGKTRLHKTRKSHINFAVCDSDWELNFCRILEDTPGVIAYVRNDGLGFEVPYEHKKREHRYRPDFIVLCDDGGGADDPLRLVVEIKGRRDEQAQAKTDTMQRLWVPAVNNAGKWGRWNFVEIMDLQNLRNAAKTLAPYVAGGSSHKKAG